MISNNFDVKTLAYAVWNSEKTKGCWSQTALSSDPASPPTIRASLQNHLPFLTLGFVKCNKEEKDTKSSQGCDWS